MPLDGFTLGYVARELSSALVGGRVDKVMQPERDELHIVVRGQGATYRLLMSASANHARAQLTDISKLNPQEPPMLCMLLRKHLAGGRVADVKQIDGDRVLHIVIDNIDELGDAVTFTLIGEFMGRHSNVILVNKDGIIIDSVRRVTAEVSRVREVLPGLRYEAPLKQMKLVPSVVSAQTLEEELVRRPEMKLSKALSDSVLGLSAVAAAELAARALWPAEDERVKDIPDIANVAETLAVLFKSPPAADPRLLQVAGSAPSDFLPFVYLTKDAASQISMPSICHAMDQFFDRRDRAERVSQKTQSLNKTLRTALERCERKLQLQLEQLEQSAKMEEFRVTADLIVAHQGTIPRGKKTVLLVNYFDENLAEIEVQLDEALNPMQNAQRYYKKYQKARAAQTLAAEQAEATRADMAYLESQLQSLSTCADERDIDEIRAELVEEGFLRRTHTRKTPKKPAPTKPMAYKSADGFVIEVGKTGPQNDRLCASADGDDLWLHAKDMPGSHVIVRLNRSPVPETTLRQAANLAAVYSKGSASANVPIDYTLRKYVKKPGGAKPGFVIYTHQSTIFVTPDEVAATAMETIK